MKTKKRNLSTNDLFCFVLAGACIACTILCVSTVGLFLLF